MNNVKIVPFHPEHIKLMDIREHELTTVFCYTDIEERLEALQRSGACGTIVWNNVILGVMGFQDMWKGVCEVWVIPCKSIPQHSVVFARRVKKSLELLLQTGYYHRIQIHALTNKVQDRFFEWLGFEEECVLKQFSSTKQDYKLWAIIKNKD